MQPGRTDGATVPCYSRHVLTGHPRGPQTPVQAPETAADHTLASIYPVIQQARAPLGRLQALVEVVLCSDFPTQFLLVQIMALAGMQPLGADGRLSLAYISILSIVDSVVLIGLIVMLLRMHGESPGEIFLGAGRIRTEAAYGAFLTPAIFLLAFGSLSLIQLYAPWLRTVPENPLADLLSSPGSAAIFIVVAIVAGGLREELQRAFILTRFERHLGGPVVGTVVFSAAFGLGHLLQGWDTVIVTALLGGAWSIVYLRRRSVVAPVVSHATFNVSQILGYLATT